MAEEVVSPQVESEQLSDEEAILKIAQAMKDNAPTPDEKQNVHTFLTNVIQADESNKIIKVGNLRDDKEMNELGHPTWNVRGSLEMARISEMLMDNGFFKKFFEASAVETTSSSLSRSGFLVRQSTSQTKSVADITKRRRHNRGMFGTTKSSEESGGDPYMNSGGTN